MDLIFKHTWILLIAIMTINGLLLRYRAKQYIENDINLKDGYDKLFKGWMIWTNIPWIIMAIGDLTGLTNGIWDYSVPRLMNPIVILYHISIVLIWALGSRWIYFKGGADFLVKHPGLLRIHGLSKTKDITSILMIKIIWTLCLFGGIIWFIMTWFSRIPSMNY